MVFYFPVPNVPEANSTCPLYLGYWVTDVNKVPSYALTNLTFKSLVWILANIISFPIDKPLSHSWAIFSFHYMTCPFSLSIYH